MAKDQLMDYQKALETYEVVIGLEVHVELNIATLHGPTWIQV